MCGISAFLSLEGQVESLPNDETVPERNRAGLEKSLDVIQHREPDARGVWISSDHRVGLGHVRLSIVDLSSDGDQPFIDSEDGIYAVVNGELYGHERYHRELANEYRFKGNSDCEIVIALYKHYGLSFLHHLRGEFALVLWDAKRERLFAARDRYGIKSLYYTIQENRLLVATEMKCFLKFGWRPEWCVETLRGHAWQFGHKTQELEIRSEAEMIAGVRERLIEAVKIRLRADVPIGVYLSGGLDSSCVAGIIAHLMRENSAKLGSDGSGDLSRLRCFTVQFDKDSGTDESDIAARTASETPSWDVNGITKVALSEKVNSLGMKVVLVGQGADEHFGGYNNFRPDEIQEPDLSWPESHFPDEDRRQLWHDVQGSSGAVVSGNHETTAPSSTARMVNHTQTIRQLARLGQLPFLPWTSCYISSGDPETLLAESIDPRAREKMVTKWHPLHTSQYIWTKSYLPTISLRYVGDNVDIAYHVEGRLPFLDHHLNEYANQLPPSLKMKYDPTTRCFNEKYILREATRPFVTDELYERRKKPFSGPTRFKENGPIHGTFLRLLTRENVAALGFLEWDSVQSYLEGAFAEQDGVAFRKIMLIAQFVVLMQRFGVQTAKAPKGVIYPQVS
ncbi:hypothetical protein FE257_010938 [Aspergillus nanangensis]|uniref:asparagine synthase (glutamine-hydrolyzing) n=1 Tax=Aspergillus nanangensis TaxID=2582783 RepID=A0AAD4CVT4_ASPNN|nr:hypothetical protein FE257_010938 [Aspergillus nanangensis]